MQSFSGNLLNIHSCQHIRHKNFCTAQFTKSLKFELSPVKMSVNLAHPVPGPCKWLKHVLKLLVYIFKAARRSAALLGLAVLLLLSLFCLSFPQKRKEMTIYPRVPCAAA